MFLSMHEHNKYLKAAADPRSTVEEKELLSLVASLAAAGEPVTKTQYLKCEALIGGALSATGTPIYDRPHADE